MQVRVLPISQERVDECVRRVLPFTLGRDEAHPAGNVVARLEVCAVFDLGEADFNGCGDELVLGSEGAETAIRYVNRTIVAVDGRVGFSVEGFVLGVLTTSFGLERGLYAPS